MLFKVNQTLIRVYYLFQIRILINYKCERMIVVIFFVNSLNLAQINFTIDVSCSEYSTGKVTSDRNKIDGTSEAVLQ